MKKCPYCAEQVRDEALRCPYCRSDLTVDPARGTPRIAPQTPQTPQAVQAAESPAISPLPSGPVVGEGALRFSHSGERYILGYGADFFGIWDRGVTGPAVLRYPRNDEGWNEAWAQFVAREPRSIEVPTGGIPPPDVRQATGTFRSAHGPARWTAGLLAAGAVATLVAIPFRANQLSVLHAYQRGAATVTQVNQAGSRAGAVGLLAGVITIATIVLWLVWQHRAQSNLRALGVSNTKYSPGWVVGWWFVPVAWWAMPYLTVRELWKASNPNAGAVDWKSEHDSPLLMAWWGAWILRTILGIVSVTSTTVNQAGPPFTYSSQQLIHRVSWGLSADVASVIAAVFAFLVVGTVDRRQTAKRERHAAAWGSGATPPSSTPPATAWGAPAV